MADGNANEDKLKLMEEMNDDFQEFLRRESIDSSELIGFLHMRGVNTLKEFYEQDIDRMKRFLAPAKFDKLRNEFEDNQITKVSNKRLKRSNSLEDLNNIDEKANRERDPFFDYNIEKDANGKIGNALIIVNKQFNKNIREGADQDLENLKTMFKNLNVKTESHFNLDGKKMRQHLKVFVNKKEDVSIVFVAISTHGAEDNIVLSTDGKHIDIKYYIDLLQKNDKLIGKPKIFFIQACRGDLVDEQMIVARQVPDKPIPDTPPTGTKIIQQTFASNTSDVLIAYATSDKHKAWRDPDCGSWFITELKKAFENYPQRHLIDILIITTNCVIQEHIAKVNGQIATECCNFHSSLTRFVYL